MYPYNKREIWQSLCPVLLHVTSLLVCLSDSEMEIFSCLLEPQVCGLAWLLCHVLDDRFRATCRDKWALRTELSNQILGLTQLKFEL
jgi:hypothetical protein